MADTWTPPTDYRTRPVAVLGGGVLGRRIACCWAAAGYAVHIRDPSAAQRQEALQYIHQNEALYASVTDATPGSAQAFEHLRQAVEKAWLVFEAVPEKIQIKIDTFAELEALAPPDCILASISSSYKSLEMLDKVNDSTKTRILNTDYMRPPEKRIVELMTDGYTAKEIFPFLVQRHKEAGLYPFVARKESTGFIFNRIWAAITRECLMVLSEGVSVPEEIDSVSSEMYGSPIGPCRMMDNVGLDTVAFIEEHYIRERGLPSEHTRFLTDTYLHQEKLGAESPKGGLYPPPTKILILDVGLSQPRGGKSVLDIIHSGRVLELSSDGKTCRTIVEKQSNPDGIDVDTSTKRLYWTCMGLPTLNDGSIMSSNVDGSDVQIVILPGNVHTPKQLVIDQVNRKLYVADHEGLRAHRSNLDGTGLETLMQTGDWKNPAEQADHTKWCVGIAISPGLGKIFWTQKGGSKSNQGRIFRANIDIPTGETPSNRSDITCILQDLPEPIHLEVNEVSDSLLWTDRGELPFGNTLNKVQLDSQGNQINLGTGLTKHNIISQNFDEAIGLKVDKDGQHIYVSDLGGTLWKCSLDGSKKEKLYEDKSCAFTGLTLVH